MGAGLSGSIVILESSAIDGDVNDTATPVQPNDTFERAQPLASPTTVGGYANTPGTGTLGNLQVSGDTLDMYQVELGTDDAVVLSIADSDSADLDLRLYDDARLLVDASLGFGKTESVAPPVAGTYFVEVFAFDNASNYVLSIGRNKLDSLDHGMRIRHPLVPYQALLETDPGASLPASARLIGRAGRAQLVADATPTPLQRQLQLPAGAGVSSELRARYETLLMIKSLAAVPGIHLAEPNAVRQALLTPDDQFFDLQWHYEAINIPQAWDLSTGSPDVVVAVIDTGVLLGHPDLQGQLTDGYDFVAANRSNDGDGPDANPNDAGDARIAGASSFHGTHVSGTVAARTGNAIGVAGVGFNSRVMPIRVLGINGTTSAELINAILFAADLPNGEGVRPSRPADIINMSLGGGSFNQCEQNAIVDAVDAGVIVVAAAGNDGDDAPSYPAAYDGVVSVAATTISNARASYSNFGPSVDVAAPGGSSTTDLNGDGFGDGVASTVGDDTNGPVRFGYGFQNGTSMAAPHVAGVLALMKAAYPGLTPAQVDAELAAGTLTADLGAPGRDDAFGNGLIDASAAVTRAFELAAAGGGAPAPVLVASPSALNFGPFGTTASLRTRNAGGGVLTVDAPSVDVPWLTLTEEDGNGNGDNLGLFNAAVDRSQLDPGSSARATITFTSSANSISIPVSVTVPDPDFSSNAGLHFVILVDLATGNTIDQVVSTASDATYAYAFDNVPIGDYEIIAGTDSDNDGFLCDAGEACGVYRNIDSPNTVSVTADGQVISGLDFTSGFLINLVNILQDDPAQAPRRTWQRLPLAQPAKPDPPDAATP